MPRTAALFLFLLFLLSLFGASAASSDWTWQNYTGVSTWSVSVSVDERGCGGSVKTYSYTASIQHNKAAAVVGNMGHGEFRGTFSGNTLSVPGRTIPDGSGTSKLSAFSMAFSPDCMGFSGKYAWYYSDSYGSCSGSTSLTGTRTDGTGCPGKPSCSGLDCCQYEEYKDTPLCSCSGQECCQYDEYKNTPLCVIQPNQSNDECAATPPECPVGGSAPMLLNPDIASGSKCRGACGPDCPDTCTKMNDVTQCIPDSNGKCLYVCTYYNVVSCGIAQGCQTHDDCYDACAAKGEKSLCVQLFPPSIGPCHCACDWGCYSGHGLSNCWDWMNGKGPTDRQQLYSSPPFRSEPLRSCP